MHINFVEKRKWGVRFLELKDVLGQFRWNRLTMVLVATLVFFLMLGYGAVQKIRLDSLQSKLNREVTAVSGLQAALPIPEEVKVASEEVPLDRLQSRPRWSKILYSISSRVPSRIRLTSMVADSSGIEILGAARDQEEVSGWIQILIQGQVCLETQLLSSENVQKGSQKEIQFKMRCVPGENRS